MSMRICPICQEPSCPCMTEEFEQLQAELDKYRWISVSEGPPENSNPVQVVEFGKIKEGYYNGERYLVWAGGAWCYSNKVTHHRPIILPEQALNSGQEGKG